MLEINIVPVSKDNWFECTKLSITKEQENIFPAGVVYWLAESKFENSFIPLSIYLKDTLIGFCTIGIEPDTNLMWIIAFMIDKKYQGNGYGKRALEKLIGYIRRNYEGDSLTIGHRPENIVAEKLYSSFGFIEISRTKKEVLRRLTF